MLFRGLVNRTIDETRIGDGLPLRSRRSQRRIFEFERIIFQKQLERFTPSREIAFKSVASSKKVPREKLINCL